MKPPADNGLVTIHYGFGQAKAIVARTTQPTHASMFFNFCGAREMTMDEREPSKTAIRTTMRRAVHSLVDAEAKIGCVI